MKQAELQHCKLCDKGVMHRNEITFFLITVDPYVIHLSNVEMQHGLEMSMGKAAPLAQVMGPDRDIAVSIVPAPVSVMICNSCASTRTIGELWDKIVEEGPQE